MNSEYPLDVSQFKNDIEIRFKGLEQTVATLHKELEQTHKNNMNIDDGLIVGTEIEVVNGNGHIHP